MPGGRVTRFTYDSNGNATSYFNSSYQSGKDPSPDAPRVEDVTTNIACCSAVDVSSIFKSEFAEYGSAFVVLGSISAAEPTPFGEAITGLFALGVTVIAAYEAGKAIYKAYKDGVFIDLDEDALPRIITDPSPEIHRDVIEKLPLPEQDKGTEIETLPLPDESRTGSTEIPLPEEKKDLIVTAQTSPNQMQKQIERGQAPSGVDRVDKGNSSVGSQPHIHFGDDYQSLNIDGTWGHEGGKKVPQLTKDIVEWINKNGWTLPNGY